MNQVFSSIKYENDLFISDGCKFIPTGVNIINILQATFWPIFWRQKIAKLNVIREKLLNLLLYEKLAHKMLMKLTPGGGVG
jgi:hypothetical protein